MFLRFRSGTWTQESVGGQARCDREHRGSEESIQLIRQYIPPLQSVAMLAMLEPEVHNVASSISTTVRQRHDFGTFSSSSSSNNAASPFEELSVSATRLLIFMMLTSALIFFTPSAKFFFFSSSSDLYTQQDFCGKLSSFLSPSPSSPSFSLPHLPSLLKDRSMALSSTS